MRKAHNYMLVEYDVPLQHYALISFGTKQTLVDLKEHLESVLLGHKYRGFKFEYFILDITNLPNSQSEIAHASEQQFIKIVDSILLKKP